MGLEPQLLAHRFDWPLVVLSVAIAIVVSCAALDLAGRVTASRAVARAAWLAGGAAVMGFGIWSMHYVGMLAYHLPIPIEYDWPTVIASLMAAVLASAVALYVVSRPQMGHWRLAGGSIVIGVGIAAMHYTGMAAMRLRARCEFDPWLVAASVVLAIAISAAALWLAFRVRDERSHGSLLRKPASALVMGLAIPTMHYTGMAAARYLPSSRPPDLSHAITGSAIGAIVLALVTMVILSMAVITSVFGRRLAIERAALLAAEQRYRELFARSPAGMLRVDRDGRILDCNLAAAQLFGYDSPDELMAAPMAERYFDLSERQLFIERLSRQPTLPDLERCMRRKDGTPIWLLTTVSLTTGENGMPVYEGMMIDVSDKKQREVSRLHTQKLEAVGELAAGIAHEINTPVQFVSDNTRFLQDSFADIAELVAACDALASSVPQGVVEPQLVTRWAQARERADWSYVAAEVPKALAQMQDGLARVARIVGAMKVFSHVDQSTDMAAADINRALDSTLVVSRNEYKYVATVETDFGELPPVICHVGDLNQVFLNLVINAAHAIEDAVAGTEQLGRIEIRTRRDGDWIQIDIADSGTGIPEAVRDKIFDPFFTTKALGRGSGQGLALARAIVVEQHGGTLTFDTAVGKGTTFHVRLPIRGHAVDTARAA